MFDVLQILDKKLYKVGYHYLDISSLLLSNIQIVYLQDWLSYLQTKYYLAYITIWFLQNQSLDCLEYRSWLKRWWLTTLDLQNIIFSNLELSPSIKNSLLKIANQQNNNNLAKNKMFFQAYQMETVNYIRVELVSIFASNLTKFLMIVFVMLQWNSALYFILFLQMVSSASLDYGFASGKIYVALDQVSKYWKTQKYQLPE